RCRALRVQYSAEGTDEAEGRGHVAAGNACRCAGFGALRQRDAHGRADGPRRRPRRHPRDQALAPAQDDARDVREGGRTEQADGGPMNHQLGLMIESLVAILLMVTVGYCMLLNKRLKRLRADEHSLKAVIGELVTATEIAERAIGGLKHAVRDVNENLGQQLTAATLMSDNLKRQLAECDHVVRRLAQIAVAPRPQQAGQPGPAAPPPE